MRFISLFLFQLFYLNGILFSQTDSLSPLTIVYPFEISDSIRFTSLLHNGKPVGDINGDGKCDFIFHNFVVDIYGDKVTHSVLVLDVYHPDKGIFMKSAYLKGVGDFNGDGYADLFDSNEGIVFFGSAEGVAAESKKVCSENMELLYYGDLNNNGSSEFIVSNNTGYFDSAFVISYTDSVERYINVTNSNYFIGISLFVCYDYDADDTTELLMVNYDWVNDRYQYSWFVYDAISMQYNPERVIYQTVIHEPYESFTSTMSDINGDGLKDMCHLYFVPEHGFDMEVSFANNQSPNYFDEPVEIEMGNADRLLYNAGDLNGDNADDWYSKQCVDTLVVYFGNTTVAENGFDKRLYASGEHKLYISHSKWGNLVSQEQPELFDYNGDGNNDLLFDFRQFDGNQRYWLNGSAIIAGNDMLDFENPLTVANSNVPYFNGDFGKKVKSIGDINDDGYDDWAVLSPNVNKLDIYYGGKELDFKPDKVVLLPQYPMTLSANMTFGDLNNDGNVELIISNSSTTSVYSPQLSESENLYVFSLTGNKDTLYYLDAIKTITDKETFYLFGNNLSVPGDYNADGYNDLIVGGAKHKKCLREAFVFYGGDTLSSKPDEVISVHCTTCGIPFAEPISTCGDVNADGFIDFTLGDPANKTGQSLIYFGGPDADSLFDAVIVNSDENGHYFGTVTSETQGDVDADGFNDLVYWNASLSALEIYRGGEEFDILPDFTFSDTSLLVSRPFLTGYINSFSKRGRADILVSLWSNANNLVLFAGGDSNKTSADYILLNGYGKCYDFASGDFNNDGFTDIIAGIPGGLVKDKVYGGLLLHFVSPLKTDIKERKIDKTVELNIFPNPAICTLQIEIKTDRNQKVISTVFDVFGRKIVTRTGYSNEIQNIDISGLSLGLYVVSVSGESFKADREFIKSE